MAEVNILHTMGAMNSEKKKNRFELDGDEVGKVMASLVKANRWEKQLELYSIFTRWPELVEKEIADHAAPVRIDRDVLWLEVANSSWMTEFQYRKIEIEDAVNQALTVGRIRDVRMALPRKGKVFIPQRTLRPPKVDIIPPSKEEQDFFCARAASITDEVCRQSFISCWYVLRSKQRE